MVTKYRPIYKVKMNLSSIPSVDRLLQFSPISDLVDLYGRTAVRNIIRAIQEEERAQLSLGIRDEPHGQSWFAEECKSRIEYANRPSIRPVFNLTGTVLHTNLGRALLPSETADAINKILTCPCNLEYDIESGSRGDRDSHIEDLICELTNAEAATVVNNNAAAVLLVLNALARGKEVIVSRGELIEIGGSFRIPDIMLQAGCRLREVGTTNRTHAHDYINNVNEDTSLIMKVHTSNYRIEGFSASVTEKELCKIGKAHNISVVSDLGSGSLVDLTQWGLPKEPTIQEILEDGVDIVTFSGDKLLGGPQAGIIVGKKVLINKIRKDPLKRALRLDKIMISALASVLKLYHYPEKLIEVLPTLKLLTRKCDEIEELALRIKSHLQNVFDSAFKIEVKECKSQIGSGALPVETLESYCIMISHVQQEKNSGDLLNRITIAFAKLPTPVIGRIKDQAFCLDIRCLYDEKSFISQLEQFDLKL